MLYRLFLIGSTCLVALHANSTVSKDGKTGMSSTKQAQKSEVESSLGFLRFLQKAYDTNPELLGERSARSAQESELLVAYSRFGPSVHLAASAKPKSMSNVFGGAKKDSLGDTVDSFSDTEYLVQGKVDGRINLFRGGSDTFGVMAALAKQDAYDIEHLNILQKFILDAVEVYVNVLKGRQALNVYTTFERQARHNFERVQTEFTVGSSTKTNVLTAKAELAQATSNRMKAHTELINAEQAYVEKSGEAAPPLTYPKNNLKLPNTLKESLEIAERHNLGKLKGESGVRAARYGLAATVLGSVSPTVDLTLTYSRSLERADKDKPGDASIGVQVSYELFSNSSKGNHFSQLKRSTHEKVASGYKYEHALNVMVREVKAAWHGLKTTESNRSQADLAVDAARNAYAGAVEEFRLGQRAYLDLLKVQEQLLKAELNHIEATKAEILGRYKMLAAMGVLTPEAVGLNINEQNTTG